MTKRALLRVASISLEFFIEAALLTGAAAVAVVMAIFASPALPGTAKSATELARPVKRAEIVEVFFSWRCLR